MDKEQGRIRNRRVHMANERTFLAWIRTSIAIMAFGFVVEKFALFVRQFTYYLTKERNLSQGAVDLPSVPEGVSGAIGLVLVGFGALMGLLAFIRYKKMEQQIDEDTFRPSRVLDLLLTISILAVGLFLVLYLLHRV